MGRRRRRNHRRKKVRHNNNNRKTYNQNNVSKHESKFFSKFKKGLIIGVIFSVIGSILFKMANGDTQYFWIVAFFSFIIGFLLVFKNYSVNHNKRNQPESVVDYHKAGHEMEMGRLSAQRRDEGIQFAKFGWGKQIFGGKGVRKAQREGESSLGLGGGLMKDSVRRPKKRKKR